MATPANPSPIRENTGLIVCRPMGLPITAGCDTARGRTRVCIDDLNHCATWGSGKEGRTLDWMEQGSAIVIGILDLSVVVFVRAMCFLATICVGLQTIEIILPVKYMESVTLWQGCDTKIQVTMRPYSEYFHSPSSLQASKQVRAQTHTPTSAPPHSLQSWCEEFIGPGCLPFWLVLVGRLPKHASEYTHT